MEIISKRYQRDSAFIIPHATAYARRLSTTKHCGIAKSNITYNNMETVSPNGAKKLIVLIEDEDIMLNLLKTRLEKAGYLVKTAQDGATGLALIQDLKPDLVLLDMMLPRLSGFGVLEKLYEEKIIPALPVIIISNSGQPVEAEHAMKLGARDYLVKVNFEPNDVLAKVARTLATETENETAEKKTGAPAAGTTAHILLVEDDSFLQELLARKFTKEGYSVSAAMDAEHAKKILAERLPDLILLDLVLPGTDGITFLGELKNDQRFQSIPVIIVSNLGQADAVERGKKAGAADYIIKANVTPNEIVQKAARLIASNKK